MREALLLELRLVLLLAAAEVLLLDLRDLLVDVLVGDLDAQVLRLLLELRLLDEVRHRLVLQRLVLGVPGFGNVAFARDAPGSSRRAIRSLNSAFVIVVVADDGDRVGTGRSVEPPPQPAATSDDGEQQCDGQEAEKSHVNPSESEEDGAGQRRDGRLHAAWRASKIASTAKRLGKSVFAPKAHFSGSDGVDGGVDAARGARFSSSEPRTSGPTVALPPRKTR